MIFSCDVDKPEHTTCEDIPYTVETTTSRYEAPTTPLPPLHLSFLTTSSENPWQVSSTPAALYGKEDVSCPEVCPEGPPGPPGPKVK